MEGYNKLRFAIVEKAAHDYMKCRKDLYYFKHGAEFKRSGKSITTEERVAQLSCELNNLITFFTSQYFVELCSLDGQYILNRLNDDFEEWTKKNLRKQKIGT